MAKGSPAEGPPNNLLALIGIYAAQESTSELQARAVSCWLTQYVTKSDLRMSFS